MKPSADLAYGGTRLRISAAGSIPACPPPNQSSSFAMSGPDVPHAARILQVLATFDRDKKGDETREELVRLGAIEAVTKVRTSCVCDVWFRHRASRWQPTRFRKECPVLTCRMLRQGNGCPPQLPQGLAPSHFSVSLLVSPSLSLCLPPFAKPDSLTFHSTESESCMRHLLCYAGTGIAYLTVRLRSRFAMSGTDRDFVTARCNRWGVWRFR